MPQLLVAISDEKDVGEPSLMGLIPEEFMLGSADFESRGRSVLVIAPDCPAMQRQLTADEGFLLSRVDGHTPWNVLREIGGSAPDWVDARLEAWLGDGIVEFVQPPSDPASPREAKAPKASSAVQKSDPQIDPDLDISVETQRRLVEFEKKTCGPYHELFGIEIDAEPREVKKAYFELSKEFHPDRFFRRNLGSHSDRADKIFRKILEGYEILSDPDSHISAESPSGRDKNFRQGGAPDAGRTNRIERLRQRMPHALPWARIDQRRSESSGFFEAAKNSRALGHDSEALISMQIAIQLDPGNPFYRRVLADLKLDLAEARSEHFGAHSISRTPDLSGNRRDILDSLAEAARLDPDNPTTSGRCAMVALKLARISEAVTYAKKAVAQAPDSAEAHRTLGLAHRFQGDQALAAQHFRRVLELDPDDKEALKFLNSQPPGSAKSDSLGVTRG